MTAIGVVIATPDLAFAWADTMTIQGDVASNHQVKMAVNPVGTLVAVGTGWCPVVTVARDTTAGAMSLADLLDELPQVLRLAVADLADRHPEPETMSKNKILVAGWSDYFRRIVAYKLSGDAFFVPELVTADASPKVSGLVALHPSTSADLEGELIDQLDTLRRAFGFPVTGRVAIATVRPNEITARVVPVPAVMSGGLGASIEQPRAVIREKA